MSSADRTTAGPAGSSGPDVRHLALGGAVEPAHLPRSLRWRRARDAAVLRFDLAWPEGPPPPGGHPLLVVTDANAMFATLVEAARLQAAAPDHRGPREPVILGIGHDTPALFDVPARRRDYAPPGSEHLVHVLADLVDHLGRLMPLDAGHRALAGHSLGGLFVLTTLFRRPDLFSHFIAASPSIWFARATVEESAARFLERPDRPRPPRLLILAGGLERGAPRPEDQTRLHPERRAVLAERRMVEEAQALAARLATGAPGKIAVQCHVIENETHTSVVPIALSRAVRFFAETDA